FSSQDLGIGLSSLQRWLHEVEKHSKNNAFPGSGNLRVEDDELRYLKREIDVLRRERDILKKALANSTGHDNTSSRISAGEEDFNVFLGLSFNCLAI
ncbi:MAG: hypothetical protein O7C59_12275, partial [Rickettsia endosymbiont of Ixodes persulcatus]|nr:hypothetical protein [Rickettsia endosymbiont of Ixodes persulcatus]